MDTTHDVFVSHNGLDKPIVERLCGALLEAGLRPWLDKWDLAPGDVWMTEIERVLAKVPAVIVCVGEHGLSAWHDAERQAALDRTTSAGAGTVVPVLLPGAPESVELPIFLRGRQAVDLREEAAWAEGVARLAATIAGREPQGPAAAEEGRVRPYRGLRAFTEADAGWMFGREHEEQKLLAALREGQRFITVVGASGSGKSSLVRAGVIPAVRTGAFDGRQRWRALVMRPGPKPHHALALRLLELRHGVEGTAADVVADGRYVDELAARLLGSETVLADQADLLLGTDERDEQLLLVIDQLEELFTEASRGTAATKEADAAFAAGSKLAAEGIALLRNLLCATSGDDGRVRVILTVRADFTGDCLAIPELARRMERMSFALAPMGPEQLRAAIRRPALRVGYDVEASLVDALVEATAGVAGRLPLFQHTLDLLWDVRDKQARRMTYASYVEHVGSIEESVARRAESVFAALVKASASHEAVVQRVFLRLVHLGEGTSDSRRQVLRSDLPSEAAVATVIDAFVVARLLVTDAYRGGSGAQPEQAVEIAHEALLGRWGRLRRWLNESREALRIRQEVDLAAADWQQAGRPAEELWRGGRLARALETLAEGNVDFSPEERAFLAAGKAAAEKERLAKARRQRWLLAGALGVSVVLALALTVALVQFRKASRLARDNDRLARQRQRQADLKEKQAMLARAQAKLAQEQKERAEAATAEAELARARAEDLAREEQGARASVLALLPGQQHGALELGVLALGSAMARGVPSTQVTKGVHDALTHTRRVVVLEGHSGPIAGLAWSPDGTRLASQGREGGGAVRLWNAETDEVVAILGGREPPWTASLAWSPDGSQLATGCMDGTVRLWDGETGVAVAKLSGHMPGTTLVAWQPDGKRLASAGQDLLVKQWDLGSGTATATLVGHAAGPTQLAWSLDGKHLASASLIEKMTRLWDPETGATTDELERGPGVSAMAWSPTRTHLATVGAGVVHVWNGSTRTELFSRAFKGAERLAWSPDGDHLASASIEGTIAVWNVLNGATVAAVDGHPGNIMAVAWAPDGTRLATASQDRTVRLWSARSGEPMGVLQGHEGEVLALAWSPDGERLASAGGDATVRLWDRREGDTLAVLRGHAHAIDGMAWSADGKHLATYGSDGTVRLWDGETGATSQVLASFAGRLVALAQTRDGMRIVTQDARGLVTVRDGTTGAERFTLPDAMDVITRVAWSPDGTRLAIGCMKGAATLWDGEMGRKLGDLGGHTDMINALSWTTDGSRLATASEDRTVRVWDGRTGEAIRTLLDEAKVRVVAWSPDGRRLASGSSNGKGKLWDASSGAVLATLEGHANSIDALAWSPDGASLATASKDYTARLWDGRTGALRATLAGHTKDVTALAWMPDGTRLATASLDHTARLWDGQTGEALVTLRGHDARVTAVAWSPDGTRLATTSGDHTVRLWPGSTAVWLHRACDVLERSTGAITLMAKTKALCAAQRPKR